VIVAKPGPSVEPNISVYMHAVVDYLETFSKTFDPEDTGLLSRAQWLYEICDILAHEGADCQCGKPAFKHLKCYDLFDVPQTAFHVAILNRHTTLEKKMIEDGRSVDSVCPYLKVSKKDPMFLRRNAIEWACQCGFDDTVRRLLEAATEEGEKPETYIPTAAAIAAVRGNAKLLEYLLCCFADVSTWDTTLQYLNRMVSLKEWYRKVLISLAMHKQWLTVPIMRRHYPYFDLYGAEKLLPGGSLAWETFIRKVWEDERVRGHPHHDSSN
jgi:hypothetical protein